jgi:hypothetical protein
MKLVPLSKAQLTMAPERAPKITTSFAGTVEFKQAAQPGTYVVTLSNGAWINLVQDGHYLKRVAFTGALDCPGVRKSVKFTIGAGPFVLQVSDVARNTIAVVVVPAS